VLAEFGVNYVERQALLCGCSTERVTHDYGTDLLLFTYDRRGILENGHVLVQVKATDMPRWVADGTALSVQVDRRDLLHWLNELWPVILVVYDGRADRAYWVHVQEHFAAEPPSPDDWVGRGQRLMLRMPVANRLDPAAIRTIAGRRDAVLARVWEWLRHDG
jgi:hypothetical protein